MELSTSLGFIDLKSYQEYSNLQNADINKLYDKYNLSRNDNSAINQSIRESFGVRRSQSNYRGSCETIQQNCVIGAAAEATIMHFACGALDLAVIPGLICHGAAIAYQISASSTCNTNYERCLIQE